MLFLTINSILEHIDNSYYIWIDVLPTLITGKIF